MGARSSLRRIDRRCDVYLSPGFLGFVNLGRITYFGHLRQALSERFAALGFDARIHIVRTPPTASLPTRAARLAETIARTARKGDAPLHLIGHSSDSCRNRLGRCGPAYGRNTVRNGERRHRSDAFAGLGTRHPRRRRRHLDALGYFRDAAHTPRTSTGSCRGATSIAPDSRHSWTTWCDSSRAPRVGNPPGARRIERPASAERQVSSS